MCVDGPALITPRLGGARFKYFGAYMQRYVFQIWGAKEITKIEQFKGKTVAVFSTAWRHRHRHARDTQKDMV